MLESILLNEDKSLVAELKPYFIYSFGLIYSKKYL